MPQGLQLHLGISVSLAIIDNVEVTLIGSCDIMRYPWKLSGVCQFEKEMNNWKHVPPLHGVSMLMNSMVEYQNATSKKSKYSLDNLLEAWGKKTDMC